MRPAVREKAWRKSENRGAFAQLMRVFPDGAKPHRKAVIMQTHFFSLMLSEGYKPFEQIVRGKPEERRGDRGQRHGGRAARTRPARASREDEGRFRCFFCATANAAQRRRCGRSFPRAGRRREPCCSPAGKSPSIRMWRRKPRWTSHRRSEGDAAGLSGRCARDRRPADARCSIA